MSHRVAERLSDVKIDGEVLTDDFAPVEYLKAIERHNEKQS